jgi:hypothetical protein
VASNDRNPILSQPGETARDQATSAPPMRLLPTPHPRAEGGLPKRYVGLHRPSADPERREKQRTVDELAAQIKAERHITAVQAQCDAEDVAS